MSKSAEEKLDEVLAALIRLEPICEDVKSLKKWRDGNGVPGAKFQLWVLWAVFSALVIKVWDKL